MGAREGWLRWFSQLVTSDADLDASNLRQVGAQTGCQQLTDCSVGDKVALNGRLLSVTSSAHGSAPLLSAELFDGTGTVTLLWLGRRRIAGINPGRSMTISGRVTNKADRKVIYNPRYVLAIAPA